MACCAAALLLIALWLRSNYCRYNVQFLLSSNRTFQCSILPGRLHFRTHEFEKDWISGVWQVHCDEPDFNNWDYPDSPAFLVSVGRYSPGDITVHFPYWFPIAVLTVLAWVPWIPRSARFSLRTLFITTTLIAAALGLAAYKIRN